MPQKVVFGVIGIILLALVGWVIGALLENPIASGGLQFMGIMISVLVALAVLALGEALKAKE